MPARLTIAIPTVNRRQLLKRALDSALGQSLSVDIIVSDNGSTDGTAAYLSSLELPARVRRFRHELTMPIQKHGAFIVSQVNTEWVVFLSDDDFLEPEFAARVLGLIEEKPEIALVYTGCYLHFDSVRVPANIGPRFEPATAFLFEFMYGQRNICMCATAFRVDDMRRIGPQPESCVIGDMYYWTRILAAGGIVGCIAANLSNYFYYRPGILTETSRTAVEMWAAESEQLASMMCATIFEARASPRSRAEVKRGCAKFLARTVSNQLVWSALRGTNKIALLQSSWRLARYLTGDVSAPLRVVSSVILPRTILEWLVLAHARRLASVTTY